MNGPKNETAIRAAKTLMHYTKLANDVLGLRVKVEEKSEPEIPLMTPEELIELHRSEIEKLEKLIENEAKIASRIPRASSGSNGEGSGPH